MSKKEFIDKLKKSLTGSIHEADVASNLEYYSDYIDSEVRKGKTEEEVIKDLGSPNLIAKTIITTNRYGGSRYVNRGSSYNNESESERQSQEEFKPKGFGLNNWITRIIALIIFAAIVVVLIGTGAACTYVMARFALPLIVILVVVLLLRRR